MKKPIVFHFDKCASSEQIIETLTAGLAFARSDEIEFIEISMKTKLGATWYANGGTKKNP